MWFKCSDLLRSADNLTKTLGYFGVTSGTRLSVDDFLQNYKLVITIVHR